MIGKGFYWVEIIETSEVILTHFDSERWLSIQTTGRQPINWVMEFDKIKVISKVDKPLMVVHEMGDKV